MKGYEKKCCVSIDTLNDYFDAMSFDDQWREALRSVTLLPFLLPALTF